MVKRIIVSFTPQEIAELYADLNGILDTVEEATQSVFQLHKINKKSIKEAMAYEDYCYIGTTAQHAFKNLSMKFARAMQNAERKEWAK